MSCDACVCTVLYCVVAVAQYHVASEQSFKLRQANLPAALRRAMVDKFGEFDAYQLAKYNREGSRKKKRAKARAKAKGRSDYCTPDDAERLARGGQRKGVPRDPPVRSSAHTDLQHEVPRGFCERFGAAGDGDGDGEDGDSQMDETRASATVQAPFSARGTAEFHEEFPSLAETTAAASGTSTPTPAPTPLEAMDASGPQQPQQAMQHAASHESDSDVDMSLASLFDRAEAEESRSKQCFVAFTYKSSRVRPPGSQRSASGAGGRVVFNGRRSATSSPRSNTPERPMSVAISQTDTELERSAQASARNQTPSQRRPRPPPPPPPPAPARVYPAIELRAYTLKRLVRYLHISQPSRLVMQLLGVLCSAALLASTSIRHQQFHRW